MSNYSEILVSTEHAVRTVVLNRPDRLNAWTARMEAEFRDALLTADQDADVRAVVVTGAGRGFCAGADMLGLKSLSAAGGREAEPISAATGELDANYSHRFAYLLRISKPIFAAINGAVAGIGLCMTLFCDFRYMAAGQKLTTAFAKRGLIAEHGSSWMLPRLIGPMNALDLLCSGRTLLCEEAAAMGLVKLLPVEDFLRTVQNAARDLTKETSPRSVAVIKRQVYDALFQDLDAAWRRADIEMHASFASEDFREGVAHFLEKRPPEFTGR